METRFYSWPQSSGAKVRWALEELKVPYQYIELDRAKGGNRSPDYLAINPTGKVPGLVDEDGTWFESLAILLHLAEKHGVGAKLWPASVEARADGMCWSVWSQTELQRYMMECIYHGCDSPVSYKKEDRSSAAAAYTHGQYLRALDALDTRLRGREFIMGAFSLVDIPAADTLITGTMLGVTAEGRANVAAWLERCRARPARAKVT